MKLRVCCATLAALAASTPLSAYGFAWGDTEGLNGYFDTSISYGASWRVQGRAPTLVGSNNGGVGSNNADDGNLNYDSGDMIASLFKVTHELDVRYQKVGLFARGYYFYDVENVNRTGPGPIINNVQGVGYTFGEGAEDSIGKNFKMLDAYVRGNLALIGGRNTQVRVGSQVLSWGESTFILNGINVINPLDVARLRSPGAELKEALLPTPAVWVSQELGDTVSAELFGLAEFKKFELDPRGAFFSTNDFVSRDGHTLYIRGPDQHFPPTPGVTQSVGRAPDRKASNDGEFGLALRVLAPGLRNTEFGVYYVNYHHRTPIVSARRGGVNIAGVAVPIDAPTSAPTTAAAQYFVEYPENVHLYGVSFNTAGPAGIALGGEYSLRTNVPMQLAANEVLLAATGLQNSITGPAAAAASVPVGTEIQGYRRVRMHQMQVTATKAFPRVLRSDQVSVVGEVGSTWLDLPNGLYFAGYGETTAPGSLGAPAVGAGQGFATHHSWGYQISAKADYHNAIGALRLSPRIGYAQAVQGVSPTFNEGVRSLNVGLEGNLKDRWRFDVSYTAFSGGRMFLGTVNTNAVQDRDFVSLSVSYAF